MPRTFLVRTQEAWGKLLKDNNTATQAHVQRTITTFFSPITPINATSQSRDTKMGSQPGHNKGVTIDRAIVISRAPRPRPHGPQRQHSCHQQIKAVISHHRRCCPRFKDLSILDRPMLDSIRRKKL